MTIGDLRNSIEGLPDNMDVIGVYGDSALWCCGLGTAQMGRPAKFVDNDLVLVGGITVYELSFRDNA